MAEPVELRQVTAVDARFLYDLLAERPAQANINHKKMPTFDEHVAFVKSEPYAHWYIICGRKTSKMGAVYLTRSDEIGIFVLKQFQGRGVAKAAIARLIEQHPKERYLANIAQGNDVSQNLFKGLGFCPVSHTYELKID